MNSLLARCQRAQVQLAAILGDQFEFKQVSGQRGDFGDLEGFAFNSERCGGFLYLWSSGNCEFHLVDYVRSVEVIPITQRMIATAADADEVLRLLGQTAVQLVAS
jgi:hypothetical protein